MEEDNDKEAQASAEDVSQMPEFTQAPATSTTSTTQHTYQKTDASASALAPSSPVVSSVRSSPRRTAAPELHRTISQQSHASTVSNTSTLQLGKRTSMSSMRGIGAQTPPRSPISNGRRSSASLLSGGLGKMPSPREPRSRPVLTAAAVAKEYFRKDVDAHSAIESSDLPDVAVIFHDACYGHRFSRPRTSKASLSTIVERPERILAIVLGVSAAYVMLGGRHAVGTNAPRPTATPVQPPFIIRKSSRNVDITSAAVTNVHGVKWMAELKEMCEVAEAKLTQNGKELTRPKTPSSSNHFDKPKLHEGDLYLCAESLAAFEGALGGVLDAVDTIFSPQGPRRAFTCVRPPGHHCSDDYPSGFCWLNNVHVGISHAAIEHGLTHAAIFDFDLHHGDGSQSIAWAHNVRAATLPKNAALSKKTSIGYYSLHDINSYPCEWGDEDKVRNASLCIENAHGQNIWNVHLQPWRTEDEFWKLYETRYLVLIDKMRDYLKTQTERFRTMGINVRPKGAIFISAGFDASEWEGHGMQRHKVNVPTEFYARVTRDLVKLSEEEGLGVDGRVISVLEGGYSDRALSSGVLSHICGLSSTHLKEADGINHASSHVSRYDDSWWSSARLDELASRGPPASTQAKKTKTGAEPSYHSPTQSFVAKVVSQPTYQRSVANSLSRQASSSYIRPRTPTPPPPEVDWSTASYELSQLIIPQDRQTRSCQAEDLNAKATEARKSRQSTIGIVPLPIDDGLEKELEKMNLRDRRTKDGLPALTDRTRADSRAAANRRKTFGGVEVPTESIPKIPNRRLSVTSAALPAADESFVKAETPSVEPVASKVKPGPKPRAPRKTVTKPPVPRTPVASRKSGTPPIPVDGSSDGRTNGTKGMDELVSGMKNIRLKLNPPSRELHDRDQAVAAKETKKPVRAPRKAPVKKSLGEKPVSGVVASSAIATTPVAVIKNQDSTPPMDNASQSEVATVGELESGPFGNVSRLPASRSAIDSFMNKQATFEPVLADYLAPVMAPSTAPIPGYLSIPATESPNPFLQSQSDHSFQESMHTPQATHQPMYGQAGFAAFKTTLPSFSSHGVIPFAPVQAPAQIQPSSPQLSTTPAQVEVEEEYDNGFGPDHGEIALYPSLQGDQGNASG